MGVLGLPTCNCPSKEMVVVVYEYFRLVKAPGITMTAVPEDLQYRYKSRWSTLSARVMARHSTHSAPNYGVQGLEGKKKHQPNSNLT